MLEIFTTYPLLTVLIIAVVIWLIKNHIVASHDEVTDLKENIIKSLKDGKCFVTPDELGQAKTEVKTDIENRFLTLAAFAEFKSGIDNQFKRQVPCSTNALTPEYQQIYFYLNLF